MCVFMKKKIAVSYLLTFILAFTSLMTVFAAGKPVVTDGGSISYEDKGSTYILPPKDVSVTTQPDTDYYYRIGNMVYVDVLYDESDEPYGSDFNYSGSLTSGSYVKTIYPGLNSDFGTYLDTASGNKITIPALAGRPSNLFVVAYDKGTSQPSDLYRHTYYTFAGKLNDGIITVTASTEKAKAAEFYLYVAAYNNSDDVLVDVKQSDKCTTAGEYTIDVKNYPLTNYHFKVFCWQGNNAPLYEVVSINS